MAGASGPGLDQGEAGDVDKARTPAVNIPNLLTVFRIFLVPVIIWLIIDGEMQFAFICFLCAGITDALDGYLAKNFGWQTVLGAYLDPIADKVLLVSIYVVLGLFSHLPVWLVIAVVSRDILIIGAFVLSWMLNRAVAVQPLLVSKANTACQILLAAMVLAELGFSPGLQPLIPFMIWTTGVLTILSAAAYLVVWLQHMASYEEPSPVRERTYAKTRRRGRGKAGTAQP